jgi:hypothetical protein
MVTSDKSFKQCRMLFIQCDIGEKVYRMCLFMLHGRMREWKMLTHLNVCEFCMFLIKKLFITKLL